MPLSRRGFLHNSFGTLGAAAGFAAAGLPALAADQPAPKVDAGATPAPASGSPNEKLHVAIIGTGGRGGAHLDAFTGMKDTLVVAVCDPDRQRADGAAAKVKEKQGHTPKVEQDLRKILDDPKIQAVSIASTNHWHALATIWAIQAGKDVYVEKPASHNVAEGRRMVEFARKHNKVVQVGTQRRSDASTQAAMKFLHEGKLGKIQVARALCYKRRNSIGKVTGPQPVPSNVDYNLWLGPAPEKPVMRTQFHYDWHWQWDYGNGDLGNQGSHQMDIALWGLNKKKLAKSAMTLGGRFGYVDDGETPNTELSLLEFADGAKIIFEVRGLETEQFMGIGVGNIFHCTEGYLVVNGGVAAYRPNGEKIQDFGGGGDHFANFVKAVKSRKTEDNPCDIEQGHLAAGLCHQANISYLLGGWQPFNAKTKAFGDDKDAHDTWQNTMAHLTKNGLKLEEGMYRLGRWLTLDPMTERFVSDPEANKLLTREYRAPFVVPDKVA